MRIPVITGQGRHIDLDSDDYLRLITLPDACSGIAAELWELFAEFEDATAVVRPLVEDCLP